MKYKKTVPHLKVPGLTEHQRKRIHLHSWKINKDNELELEFQFRPRNVKEIET